MLAVRHALQYWKAKSRTVKEISLRPDKWAEFEAGILQMKPELEDDIKHFERVSFKNADIVKGAKTMQQAMHVQLNKLIIDPGFKYDEPFQN